MADGVQKFFLDPFAIDGDKSAVPDTATVDGSVSYDIGWGPKYQQDPDTTGLNIPRDQFNQIMFDVTQALQVLQVNGFPFWISTAANGDTPFAYSSQATCRHNGINYFSLIDNNTDEPPSSNWGVVQYNIQAFFPGDIVPTFNAVLPSSWLWSDGRTIGSAASGATARASADTINTYTVLWNSISPGVLQIQDSSGNPTSRGASAAADFAANKRLPLPDLRGRTAFGADNLGGTPANRLTGSTTQGINGAILAASGGEQDHAPTINELFPHNHQVNYYQNVGGLTAAGTSEVTNDDVSPNGTPLHNGVTKGSTGGGQAFNEIPPGIVVYYRIKL